MSLMDNEYSFCLFHIGIFLIINRMNDDIIVSLTMGNAFIIIITFFDEYFTKYPKSKREGFYKKKGGGALTYKCIWYILIYSSFILWEDVKYLKKGRTKEKKKEKGKKWDRKKKENEYFYL